MISKNTIDQVFDAARVEEVIGDFVQLKKSGSNFKGLSPFSDEKTPSFMVSPVKQIWKDFSSGKGGNVVAFLMEHEHFNYPEAIKYLAKKYGIEIEETQQTDEQKEQASERESLYVLSEFARDYFHQTLIESEEGKAIGKTYFTERGFTEETIAKFQLGYSPEQWDAFTNHAIEQGYQLEYLEKTGLSVVKEERKFDRFRARVMFPILSMSGRTLGFGGRILSNEKKAAKYLNSPESDIYHKSKVLYGIYHAKQSIAKEDNCFLVEGYTDVIQMYQLGIQNVVSSSGTALTPEQIRLISRLTKNITLLFDGDAAGLRASLRGVDLILEQGMNVKVCAFPEGEDPDSFAKSHTLEETLEYLGEQAADFINFKASLLADETRNDPIKKAETVRDMITSISKIPDAIKREVYIKECARIMDISEQVLFSSLAQMREKDRRDKGRKAKAEEAQPMEVVSEERQIIKPADRQFYLEQKIIELLLLYGHKEEIFEELILEEILEDGEPSYRTEKVSSRIFEKVYLDLQEDEIEFANDGFKELYFEIINTLNQNQELKIENFVNQLPPDKAELVTHILMEDDKYQRHNWERKDIYRPDKEALASKAVTDTLLNLRGFYVKQKIAQLMESPMKDGAYIDRSVMEDTREYKRLEKLLSLKLNRVLVH